MFEISVSSRGGKATADVTSLIGAALSRGRRYGEYLMLECDARPRVLKTKIDDMNADPRSAVFVTRSARETEGAFKVLSAALSADGVTGDVGVPLADNAEKKAGEAFVLSVTLTLSVERDGAALAGGDNPLVEWLLGVREMGEATMSFGDNRSPLGIAPPVPIDVSNAFKSSVKISERGAEFTSLCAGAPVEAVLMIDGKPAIRALPLLASAKTVTDTLMCETSGRVVALAEICGVLSVIREGALLTDYVVRYGRSSVGAPVSSGISAGEEPVLVADADFARLAAVSGNEAVLMKIVGRELVCDGQKSAVGDKNKARLSGDGALFCHDGENLVLISDNGRTEFSFEPFDDWQVIGPYSGRYTVAALRGENVCVYALENGKLSLSESIFLGSGAAIGAVDSRRLVVCGSAFCGGVIGGEGDEIIECIDCVYEDFGGSDIKFSGSMMSFVSDGEVYVIDCTLTDGYEIESGAPYKFGGEICAIDGRLYLVNATGGICDFEVPSDDGVSSYCRLEEFVVRAHKDGRIDYLPLGGVGTAIVSPSFKVGDTVNCTYLAPTVTDNGKGVNTVISIEF